MDDVYWQRCFLGCGMGEGANDLRDLRGNATEGQSKLSLSLPITSPAAPSSTHSPYGLGKACLASFSHQYCICLWSCFWKSFRVPAPVSPYVSVMLLSYGALLNCGRSRALPQKQENLVSRLSGREHKYPHRTADQKSPAGWILLNLPRIFFLH